MEHLYLFAPENDMALAFGKEHYTPTPAARKIADDLSLLPLWYAAERGAYVWSKQAVTPTMQKVLDTLRVTTRATASLEGLDTASVVCHPWGWSKYIAHRFSRAGVAAHRLPNAESLEKLRQISGRATTRAIIRSLTEDVKNHVFPALPEILRTENDVKNYLSSQPASILKAPWSSSGRGILRADSNSNAAILQAANGIIRKQGYIMGEPLYDKVQDFAMEFYSDGKAVGFAGYSLFQTDARGAYSGNLLANNRNIESRLSRYVPTTLLHAVQTALISVITPMVTPVYTGYFGVDMMIYRTAESQYLLNPCIELNLRMNMGVVARIIADSFLSDGCTGRYITEYASSSSQLKQKQQELHAMYPLRISGNLIEEGFLPLTPILPETRYAAYIIAEREKQHFHISAKDVFIR